MQLTAAALRADVAALTAALSPDPSLQQRLVSKGSTYTRLWTEHDWRAHAHIARYARHLRTWHASPIARAIAPLVCASTLWAVAIARYGAARPDKRLSLPFQPMLLFGQAITLLLTMRTNASLARLAEARGLAGRVGATCREVAALLVAYVDADAGSERLVQLAARHLCVVHWGVKRVVRGRADDAQFPRVCAALLPAAEVGPVVAAPLPPLACVARLRAIVARVHADGRLDRAAHRTIEGRLGALNDVVGACERIAQSPVPPAYTRHTSRMLLSFLVLVPVGLMDLRLKVRYVAVCTMFITYLVVGIEEVGIELEAPFAWLPLQELAALAMRDVAEEVCPHHAAPPLSAYLVAPADDAAPPLQLA